VIAGRVEPNYDAVVPVTLRGPSHRAITVSAVVDTGFNGELIVEPSVVAELHLEPSGRSFYRLADGSPVSFQTYFAEVRWHDRWRTILLSETAGATLLGMALLDGSELTMQVTPGGPVAIRELSATQ